MSETPTYRMFKAARDHVLAQRQPRPVRRSLMPPAEALDILDAIEPNRFWIAEQRDHRRPVHGDSVTWYVHDAHDGDSCTQSDSLDAAVAKMVDRFTGVDFTTLADLVADRR